MDIETHMGVAWGRAEDARTEARTLNGLGFHNAAVVWTVRAAEMFMREYVLTPHFLEEGDEWPRAMRRASNELGSSNWVRAFALVQQWWGPFPRATVVDGTGAWDVWTRVALRRRGDIVHGRAVTDITQDAADEAIRFVDAMSVYYQRTFLTSERHPMGALFRERLAAGLPSQVSEADDSTTDT